MRSSPGKASSTPPLKKYVTCAYFSVSARRRFSTPASAHTSARMCDEVLGGKAARKAELLLVFGEADEVQPRGLGPREVGEGGFGEARA